MSKIPVLLPKDIEKLFKSGNRIFKKYDETYYAFPFAIREYSENVWELIPFNELEEDLLIELLNLPSKDEVDRKERL